MRFTLGVVVAFLLGVLLAVSVTARAQGQVAPPSFEYRSVYLGETYTPADVTRVANALGAERFRLATAIQTSPYGSSLLVFMRENP